MVCRFACLLSCFLVVLVPLCAQEGMGKHKVRYKIEVNLERFPQKKPQDALKSVVKAIGDKRIDYYLAQLALPSQVDARVLRVAETFSKGSLDDRMLVAFDEVVRVSAELLLKDPDILRELRMFAAGAEWEEKDDKATAIHKELPGRLLMLHKIDNRWFLDNRQK